MTEADLQQPEFLNETRDGIGIFTFNRPHARNALTIPMYAGFADFCDAAIDDPEIKCIAVMGAGDKAFAAGTDISHFRDFTTEQQAWDYEANMDAILSRIEACPKPTVAILTGACTGGGAAIAAVCDLRVASSTLKFGFPISRTLGNCLSAKNLARLTSLIGEARVKDILFTSRLIEADEALTAGLVCAVHKTAEETRVAGLSLARTLCDRAPLTMQATKEALRRNRDAAPAVEDKDLISLCYTSDDFREGMDAFLSKRKPNWTGK